MNHGDSQDSKQAGYPKLLKFTYIKSQLPFSSFSRFPDSFVTNLCQSEKFNRRLIRTGYGDGMAIPRIAGPATVPVTSKELVHCVGLGTISIAVIPSPWNVVLALVQSVADPEVRI